MRHRNAVRVEALNERVKHRAEVGVVAGELVGRVHGDLRVIAAVGADVGLGAHLRRLISRNPKRIVVRALQHGLGNRLDVALGLVGGAEDDRNVTHGHAGLHVLATRHRRVLQVGADAAKGRLFIFVVPAGFQLLRKVFARCREAVDGEREHFFAKLDHTVASKRDVHAERRGGGVAVDERHRLLQAQLDFTRRVVKECAQRTHFACAALTFARNHWEFLAVEHLQNMGREHG